MSVAPWSSDDEDMLVEHPHVRTQLRGSRTPVPASD